MSLKIPYNSTLLHCDAVVAGLLDGASLKVFKNNYTPINTSVVGDFTEANFTGYGEITLDSWGSSALNADNKAEAVETLRTFTMSGTTTTNTVYGIYVVDGGGNLLYAERNPAGGVLMNSTGQTYSYLPKYTLKSEF